MINARFMPRWDRWLPGLLFLFAGCASPVIGLKTSVDRGFDIRYVHMAVVPASSSREEQTLSDEFYSEFVGMGIQATNRAQLQGVLENRKYRGEPWTIERVREVARAGSLDVLALVSIRYERGIALISFEMVNVEMGRTMVTSEMRYETPVLGRLPHKKIAGIMVEDIKSKLLKNQ